MPAIIMDTASELFPSSASLPATIDATPKYAPCGKPGVGINYENGDSWLDGTTPQQSAQTGTPQNEGSQSSAGSGAGESGSSGSTTGSASSGSDSSVAENSAADSSNSETMVHITATGKKYHRAGCRTLKKSDTEVTLDEAKSMGLSPCGICNPPQ